MTFFQRNFLGPESFLYIINGNKFLVMQLIYGGKTAQSLPKFKFPLSTNP